MDAVSGDATGYRQDAKAAVMRDDALSLAAFLWARSYLYQLFHKVFGGVPTKELIETLSSETAVEAVGVYADEDETMGRFGQFLAKLGSRIDEDGFLWKAEAEYTRFFVGPNSLPAPPWASPYITSEAAAFSEESLKARHAYEKQCLKPRKMHHVPDDHVALMCDFMATMAEQSLEAFRLGKLDQLEGLVDDQCAFVRDSMATWLPKFSSLACKEEGACLIPQTAKAVSAFVALDETFLGEVLVWLREHAGSGEEVEQALSSFRPAIDVGALDSLRGLRLRFLEDNELCEV